MNQNITGVNAIAVARSGTNPSNTEVIWLDTSTSDSVYERLKAFDGVNWSLINRTPLQVLDDLKTVDGAGSGLDADTLQGFTPSQLMSGGGGSTPPLATGQMLVGQGDSIGTAQTIGGIATVNTSGTLLYVPNSISHTNLTDIGANTHVQIDSHISSTSNPHNVSASQVGNSTAQWNASEIDGNDSTIGTLGAPEDGMALTWDNGTSKFIMASGGGDNMSNADLTFDGSYSAELDVYSWTIKRGFQEILKIDTDNSLLFDGDAGLGAISEYHNGRAAFIGKSFSAEANIFEVQTAGSGLRIFEVRQNNSVHINAQGTGDVVIGGSAQIGSETVSLQGDTLVKGSDTSSGTTGFEVTDSSNVSLLDVRNDGTKTLTGPVTTFKNATESIVNINSDSTDYSPELRLGFGGNYASFSVFGSTARADLSNKTFLSGRYGHGPVVISNKNLNDNAEIWFNITNGSTSDGLVTKRRLKITNEHVKVHNVSEFIFNPTSNEPTVIGSEQFSIQGDTLVKGSDASSLTTGFEVSDSSDVSLLEIRNNGDLFIGGTQGVASFTGAVTSITVKNGIITAIS